MFKYIKGFYRFIVGEDSQTKNSKSNQTTTTQPTVRTNQKMDDQHMNARVSYQYPKGNFRFPLISDDEVKKDIERRPERKREKVTEQPRQQVRKQQPRQTTVKPVEKPVKDQPKHSFKPTDVPSPIHGFHSTVQKEQQVIEYELPASKGMSRNQSLIRLEPDLSESERALGSSSDESYDMSVAEEVHLDVTEEIQGEAGFVEESFAPEEQEVTEFEIMEEPELVQDQEIDEYMETLQEVEVFQDEEPSSSAYYEIEEVEATQEWVLDTLQDEEDVVKDNEVVMTEERNSESVQVETPPKKYVPFNVVMLKQDRERLKERQEKETHQPASSLSSSPVYRFPPLHFLTMPKHDNDVDDQWLHEQQELLDVTLHHFNVRAKVVNVTQGPSVTRFEVHPEPGVKVNKITNLSDDIKLALSAKDIRMEAPIPGKNTIGIEVPNKKSKPVLLSEIISSQAFRGNSSPLTVALGLDISGKPIVTDLKKMPHGLIAGATGSGKSVCINAMLISILYKADPSQVKLLLIDPKMVELAPYNDIPHLVSPVITDVKAATAALKWAVEEMERRYERFAHSGVRDISRYNELVREHNEPSGEMPYLVIVIDELADLMMVAPGEVEESICRIAQKARACGIHLLLATQRPSVDVITGLIKANIPTRIAFSVSSQVDSRTIIDSNGADKLLGKGDMLFLENGSSKPYRLQGNFVSDQEIEKAVSFVKSQLKPEYLFEQQELISKSSSITQEEDELFYEACEFVIDQGGASSSSLQRRFRIGYNRAARLIEMMEEQGYISEQKGSKPRDVLITEDQLIEKQSN
ncbi:DNA translocase FtsK [Bacillus pinisoli]|uniref:DNA translocase FtsK n=1 Tax=Bacillus pinisoli TaxID=2901866 RepID=UPI003AF0AF59